MKDITTCERCGAYIYAVGPDCRCVRAGALTVANLRQQAVDRHAASHGAANQAVAERAYQQTRASGLAMATLMAPDVPAAPPSCPKLTATLDSFAADDKRASQLADECGALRTENRELAAENSQLRRKVERLERKAKVR